MKPLNHEAMKKASNCKIAGNMKFSQQTWRVSKHGEYSDVTNGFLFLTFLYDCGFFSKCWNRHCFKLGK